MVQRDYGVGTAPTGNKNRSKDSEVFVTASHKLHINYDDLDGRPA